MASVRKITDESNIEMLEQHENHRPVNLSNPERWAAGIGGGLLALYGLGRRGLKGTALALLGGGLVYRGVTGHCEVYKALGINTSRECRPNVSVRHGEGYKVERSVTVNRSAEDLYSFWRNFENLPRFLSRVESVRVTGDKRSRWTATAITGKSIEWDAEIINEEENELIAWRSLEGAGLPNAGSVHFERAPNGRGTQVRVVFSYEPPGGMIGTALAKLFGAGPERQLEEDLRRFKQLMEAGEVASVEGQPSSRRAKMAGK